MMLSRISRFILLALLPVMALLLYFEGQSYDPDLIRFAPTETGLGAETAFFPREIEGFHRSGQVRHYSKDDLYEYVNGHAEYFISAGFEGLAVGEYIRAGTEPEQPNIIVDIYDMGKGIHAFGVFSDEIGDNPAQIQVGVMGARTEQGISFVSGKYYVKISSFQDSMPMDEFAGQIDGMIGASGASVTEFSRLPSLGKVVSTRYVKEAYRGLDFVNDVVQREYLIEGKTLVISRHAGGEAEVNHLVSLYLEFFRDSGTPYEKFMRGGYEMYRVQDPYEGLWYLLPSSDGVFGIYGEMEDSMLDRVLSSIAGSGSGETGT